MISLQIHWCLSTSSTGDCDGAACQVDDAPLILFSLQSAISLQDTVQVGSMGSHERWANLRSFNVQKYKPPEPLQSKRIQAQAGFTGDLHSDGVTSVGKQNVGESCNSQVQGHQ